VRSGCVHSHFKGVYARYWIPEGDALQHRGALVTDERVFILLSGNPIAATAHTYIMWSNRSYIYIYIGTYIPQTPPPPLYRGIWGFWSDHDHCRHEETTMTTGEVYIYTHKVYTYICVFHESFLRILYIMYLGTRVIL